MIGGKAAYRNFVQEGLGEGHKEKYYEVEDQRFLGGEGFGETLRREAEGKVVRPNKQRLIVVVVTELAGVLEVTPEVLRAGNRGWAVSRQRTLVAYVLARRGGFKVNEVVEYFGRDATTISSLVSRYERKLLPGSKLLKDVEKLAHFV